MLFARGRHRIDRTTVRSGITVGEGSADGEGVSSAAKPARGTRRFLVLLTGTAGVMHFVRPEPFDAIVPPALPGSARTYTYLSGAAEVIVAGLLTVPATRRLGGAAAAALFAAVYPANVQMAWDWRHADPAKRAIAIGRLPLQIPLIAQGLRVMRRG